MVPLLTLVLGALLGFLSSLVASLVSHRRTIELRLLDQFFEVRKNIVEAICGLTNIDVNASIHPKRRKKYAIDVSNMFYRHYDFLPKQVLDALILLEVSLLRPNMGPYCIRDNAIQPMNNAEILNFIEGASLFRNARLFAPLVLSCDRDSSMRKNEVVRIHARHVLYTLNKFVAIEDLRGMVRMFKKKASGLN